MKTSSIFWGSFLIFFGLFLTMRQFGEFDYNLDFVLKFWPMILVIWGISMLKFPLFVKQILSGLTALLLAIFIIAVINHKWCHFFDNVYFNYQSDEILMDECDYNFQKVIYYANDDKHKYATLNFDAGAISFDLSEPSDELIEVYSNLPKSYLNLDADIQDDKMDFDLDVNIGKFVLNSGNFENKVEVKLNQSPVWDLDLNVGAAEINCDLTAFKTKDISVDAGAADIELRLGDLFDKTHLDINAGASNIVIYIPKSSACEIESKTGLSNSEFNGFSKKNGRYRTDNFKKSKNKITINISGAVSNFEVHRY